ncbi:MAG: hypothetical protein NXI22_16660 [bacterium]|nr:hypothetical protein [bacterium]
MDSPQVGTLEELRSYVHSTLCLQNDYEPDAFEISERTLTRRGEPCGMYFCLHGPRSVKLTAIWETDRNTILFYRSSGERILITHLTQAPALLPAA